MQQDGPPQAVMGNEDGPPDNLCGNAGVQEVGLGMAGCRIGWSVAGPCSLDWRPGGGEGEQAQALGPGVGEAG